MEEQIQEQQNVATEEVKDEKTKGKKRKIFACVAILAVILAGFYIAHEMHFQSTDDAYVETTTVSVSPRVSGQIEDVLIKDNQFVKEGDLVAVIDDADYEVVDDDK